MWWLGIGCLIVLFDSVAVVVYCLIRFDFRYLVLFICCVDLVFGCFLICKIVCSFVKFCLFVYCYFAIVVCFKIVVLFCDLV